MSQLRLVTWNCRSGAVTDRLSDLSGLSPDIAFLQECAPTEGLPLEGDVITRRINARKGIALATLSPHYRCTEMRPPEIHDSPSIFATVSAAATGRALFAVLGLWAHGPDYAADVRQTLDRHADLLRSGPAIVLGDLNSGTRLSAPQASTANHDRVVNAMTEHGLVSAYHAFHGVEHGRETHPTYFHQFVLTAPWHIDFCFVPASWAPRIADVRIGGPDQLIGSDHRPLLVAMDVPSPGEYEA